MKTTKNVMLVLVITNLVTLIILGFVLFQPPPAEVAPVPSPPVQPSPTEQPKPQTRAENIRPLAKEALDRVESLYDQAITQYKTQIRQDPPFWGLNNIIYIHAKEGRYEEAIQAAQQSLQFERTHPETLYSLAWTYARMQRYDEAVNACDRALQADPTFSKAAVLKAWVYARQGDMEKALEVCQQAADKNPEAPGPLYGMARLYTAAGNYNEAINLYNKTIRLKPDVAEVYLYQGLAYEEAGQSVQARQAFQKVEEMDPRYAEAYFLMGISLDKAARYDEAVGEYEKAIENSWLFKEAYLFAGTDYLRLNDISKAFFAFREAVSIDPDYAPAQFGLGLCLLLDDKLDEARRRQEVLKNLHPEMARVLNDLIEKKAAASPKQGDME